MEVRPGPPSPTNADAAALQRLLAEAQAALRRGDRDAAAASYVLAAEAAGGDFDTQLGVGNVLLQLGRVREAIACFGRAIAGRPQAPEPYYRRALGLQGLGELRSALADYDRVLALRPDLADAHFNKGVLLHQLGQYADAVACYDRLLDANPADVDALIARGNALKEMDRGAEAMSSYERALGMRPDLAQAHYNKGVVLQSLRRFDDAIESYDRAIALRPDLADPWINRGNSLQAIGKLDLAVASYDRAIALDPRHPEARYNRGNALYEGQQWEAALAAYEGAIASKLDHVGAWFGKANALFQLRAFPEAIAAYDRAAEIDPGYPFLLGTRFHARMLACDWNGLEAAGAELERRVENGESATPPFALLAWSDSFALQRRAAAAWMERKAPASALLAAVTSRSHHGKTRVGYFSADFHDHATARLMAEVFERHDRSAFEIVAFSFGPERNDAMRQRLMRAFDRFIDVRALGDRDVARLARELEIDIAVDLKGYTAGSRPGIFALRAAPVQVAFLGYPGTMAAPYIDYLVADRVLIPEGSEPHYTERIVFLPDCYQPNDRQRPTAAREVSREAHGLPAHAFVFCCFNNTFKITPSMFAAWMRILQRTPASVLWLFEENPVAARNLRSAAGASGVDPERLVFAPRVAVDDHLARHAAADLFLDSFPCNAHTTASDALWAGLPVVTLAGRSFVSRVAASLLHAAGLPGLVAGSMAEYEELAVRLASDADELSTVRRSLAETRLTTPLFDSARFTRNLEKAYALILERSRNGQPAEHVHV